MVWREISRVQAAEMKFVRSMLGVRKLDKIRSRKLRKELELERLNFRIGRARLEWFGQINNMSGDRIPKKAFDKKHSKRRVGRPRQRWKEQIRLDVEERGQKYEVVEQERWWEDEERWK